MLDMIKHIDINFSNKMSKKSIAFALLSSLSLLAAAPVGATNAWADYHWARKANPFTLKLGDNVGSSWDSYLGTASSQWTASSVLDTSVVTGQSSKNCRPTLGRVEVCNRTYGNNGWLGIAQIWINTSHHITQGAVKMNDTYFNTASYNTPGWKSLVMCQEIGHTLGLDHQDENFNNPPITPHTCMDYFVPAAGETVGPNQHDLDELAIIYSHLDSSTTVLSSAPSGRHQVNPSDASDFGQQIREDAQGQGSLFVKDLGHGQKQFTFVFWAE